MRITAKTQHSLSLDWRVALLAMGMLWGSGCAKMGEPAPPVVLIPETAFDLTAQQVSDHVVLTVSKPERNTDGSPVATLRSLEIYRFAEKVANSNQAVPLTPERFSREATPIFSIPADRFPEYLDENKLIIEDKLPILNRSEIYSYLFRYAVLFVNNKNQSAGFSNQVSIAPTPIPSPPSGLSADVTEPFIHLKWQPPSKNMDGSIPARIAGYRIFRSEEPQKFPSHPLNSDLIANSEFKDSGFQFDKTYYYRIRIVGSLQNPYAESLLSETLTVVTKDVFPPEAPTKFNAILENGIVYLLWTASASKDAAGCRIYRRETGSSEKRLLQSELITIPSFQDSGIKPGQEYEYLATAVDTHGNESAAALVKIQIP